MARMDEAIEGPRPERLLNLPLRPAGYAPEAWPAPAVVKTPPFADKPCWVGGSLSLCPSPPSGGVAREGGLRILPWTHRVRGAIVVWGCRRRQTPPLSPAYPLGPPGCRGCAPYPPFDGGEVGPAAVGRHAHTPGMWLGGYPSGADGVLDTARDLPGVQRWYIGTGGVDLRDERLFACHVPSPRTSGRACWAKHPPLKACPSPGPSFDSEPRPLAP